MEVSNYLQVLANLSPEKKPLVPAKNLGGFESLSGRLYKRQSLVSVRNRKSILSPVQTVAQSVTVPSQVFRTDEEYLI
jgi:hypothetical protein